MTADDSRPRRRPRRTWPQRFTIVACGLVALICFLAATALGIGQWVLSQRNLTELATPESQAGAAVAPVVVVPEITTPGGSTIAPAASPAAGTLAPATIELAEPEAANFLVVGADNGDCAGDRVTDEREDLGERSDTIMLWRANPDTNQLAVLSFPRDLWVEYPGGRKRKINEAFERDDPTLLQEVLYLNFGVPVDHYIQVDFCAFRRIVDAVGGVAIPFEYPARDVPTRGGPPNFLIEQTGCVNLDGTTALAYVRSRHYQYEDPPGSGEWRSDGTSDFGRISRQQDFLRRMLAKVINDKLYDPQVAAALIDTNDKYLVTDDELTPRTMLEFANALRNFDADSVTTYRIESYNETISGASVEIPRIRNDNMQAILQVFRGQATLAAAPEQVFEESNVPTTTAAPSGESPDDGSDEPADTASEAPTETADESSEPASEGAVTASTVPVVEAEQNAIGVIPDRSVSCD